MVPAGWSERIVCCLDANLTRLPWTKHTMGSIAALRFCTNQNTNPVPKITLKGCSWTHHRFQSLKTAIHWRGTIIWSKHRKGIPGNRPHIARLLTDWSVHFFRFGLTTYLVALKLRFLLGLDPSIFITPHPRGAVATPRAAGVFCHWEIRPLSCSPASTRRTLALNQ